MPEGEPRNNHSKWMALAKYIGSFAVGVIAAIFLLGGARQRMVTLGQDMEAWKTEWRTVQAPRIDRMDRVGTTSFDLFHQEYLRTQEKQERQIDELRKEILVLERHWNESQKP